MKTEVKKTESNKREINVEVDGDLVKNKFEDVFKRISQEAKVKGFRPGHVPRDILEKNYSSAAHEHVVKELVPEVYNQAVEKEGLDIIDLPEIFDVKLDRDKLSFKAKVELSPEIPVKDYRGIKVKFNKLEVSAEELKRSIDSIKEARHLQEADDDLAKSLGYPQMQELEEALKMQLYLQKENAQRHRIEREIIDRITKDVDFKIPQRMLERQLEEMVRQAKVDLALRAVPKEKIDEQEKTLKNELEPEARNQVKVYLVLSAIAKKEGIPQDKDMPRKVIELLLKSADWDAEKSSRIIVPE
ncbi:trigger factor [Candidatus Omnitrophota bacterium]